MSNRNAVAGRLWQAAEHNIIAEWICCEPLEPGHTLCAQGYAAMRMLKALLVDDPNGMPDDDDDDHKTWDSLVTELTDKVASELAVITWRVKHPWLYRRGRLPARPVAYGCVALCGAVALLNLTALLVWVAVPWALSMLVWLVHVRLTAPRSGE